MLLNILWLVGVPRSSGGGTLPECTEMGTLGGTKQELLIQHDEYMGYHTKNSGAERLWRP